MSTVRKAISLLELFTLEEPEIGLSDLARKAGLDKATARRLLVALAAHRLIEQAPVSRRYRLGAGLTRLARVRDAQLPLVAVAVPLLRELSQQTGETVHLSEYSSGALLTIHVELSPKANRVNVNVGQILPLHGTASGIALLAFAREEVRLGCLGAPLTAFTAHTTTDVEKLWQTVRLAAERGYSRSAQGYEEGVHSVAAPILGSDGYPIGTVAIASPVSRADDSVAAAQGAMVIEATRRITTQLIGEAVEPAGKVTGQSAH